MNEQRLASPPQQPERLDATAWNPESVKWVEDQALLVSAFQERVIDALEKQAASLLNLLLAGAGGALAYAVNLAEKHAAAWQSVGVAAVSVWLFFVAALVLWRAMWSREIYPPANDPGNLVLVSEMDLTKVRVLDLKNHQAGIAANRVRNDVVGRWLNTCRLLAAGTPIVFVMSALVAWAY